MSEKILESFFGMGDINHAVESLSKPNSFLLQLFTASFSWAFQEQPVPPKYQYRDPVTSQVHSCDQCPPGTSVKRHCTADTPTECQPCPERHFAENWHWGDTCQYCTSVRTTQTHLQTFLYQTGFYLFIRIYLQTKKYFNL